MNKILINRSDAIGDLILTFPVATWIKKHMPNTKVGFIVRPGHSFFKEMTTSVDEIFEIPQTMGLFKSFMVYRKIFQEFTPDVFVQIGGNKWGSFFAFLFRIKNRLGLKNKILSFIFLNNGIRQSRSLALMHETEYNIGLLNPLFPDFVFNQFDEIVKESYSFPTYRKEEGLALIKQIIPTELNNKIICVIHPGMTGHSLNWSARNYARLAQTIINKYENVEIIFSYTPSDKEFIKTVKEQLGCSENQPPSRMNFFDGSKVGLPNFVKFLSAVDFYIGGSTGPTHLAGILGIPFITIFSPIRTQSAFRWHPLNLGQKFKVITPDVVCGEDQYCAGRQCPYFDCMGKIEVKDVFDQFSLILDNQ